MPSLKMRRSAGRSSGCLIYLMERLARRVPPHASFSYFHPAAHGGGRGRSEPSRVVTPPPPTPPPWPRSSTLPGSTSASARSTRRLPSIGTFVFMCQHEGPATRHSTASHFWRGARAVVGNEIMVATMEAWFGACFGVDVCGLIGLWVDLPLLFFVHISLWHISRCHRIMSADATIQVR